MKNGMFWSEIVSRFKKQTSHPHRQLRGLPPLPLPPRTEPTSFNISFATHARINEIKRTEVRGTYSVLITTFNYMYSIEYISFLLKS